MSNETFNPWDMHRECRCHITELQRRLDAAEAAGRMLASAWEAKFNEQGQRLTAAEARIACVVRNCANLDDTTPRDEPGPLCGPTWAKVAHVCGLGSTSAHELCRKVGVDPNYDCRKAGEAVT